MTFGVYTVWRKKTHLGQEKPNPGIIFSGNTLVKGPKGYKYVANTVPTNHIKIFDGYKNLK